MNVFHNFPSTSTPCIQKVCIKKFTVQLSVGIFSYKGQILGYNTREVMQNENDGRVGMATTSALDVGRF